MTGIFRWKISPGMTVETDPQVITVKFGDGCEQRRAAGLNPLLKKFSCTVVVDRKEAQHVEAFLCRQAGYKAFLWTPPYEFRQLRVVCRKWSSAVELRRVRFTLEFEQVVF